MSAAQYPSQAAAFCSHIAHGKNTNISGIAEDSNRCPVALIPNAENEEEDDMMSQETLVEHPAKTGM
jgi:hypothetical protein